MSSEGRGELVIRKLEKPIIYYLARFTTGTTFEELPEKVVKEAKLCVLDTIGCMLSGAPSEEVRRLVKLETEIGGKPRSTVVFYGLRYPAATAARINGYMGDIMELNDLTGGHASVGNIPAALAMAEARRASGADFLTAVVVGIEVTSKIYDSYYPYLKPYTECGIVPICLPSTIGIAAATSKLLGLSLNQTENALAIAASLTGWCPAETIFGEGGTIKPLLFGGWPATVGIYATACAQNGISGPSLVLESEKGFLITVASKFDSDKIVQKTWALEEPGRKAHACCGYFHSSLDAVMALMEENKISPENVHRVHIEVPEYVYPAVSKDQLPKNPNEARFHLQYCTAVVATKKSFIVPSDTLECERNLTDPLIGELIKKVEVVPNSTLTHYYHAIVTIATKDGRSFRLHNEAPKGSPKNPLSEEELLIKYDILASTVFDKQRREKIKAKVYQLEKIRDICILINLLVKRAP